MSEVATSAGNAAAQAAPTASEYIVHHLTHLQNKKQADIVDFSVFNYDSIFAATEKGIYKAWIDDPSLENYLAWKPVAGQPFRGQTFNHLAYNDGMLWASHLSPTGDKAAFVRGQETWNPPHRQPVVGAIVHEPLVRDAGDQVQRRTCR